MAKWFNDKDNQEIIKKIEDIKLDVAAYAKDSIDSSLFAIDKAQNARLDLVTEKIEEVGDCVSKYIKESESVFFELKKDLGESNSDLNIKFDKLLKNTSENNVSFDDRFNKLDSSIEHLSNDYFTNKNKVNFRIIETDNNFKLCSTEILSIREEIDDIYLNLNAVNSKIDKLFLLIGLVGFAVLGDILWTLINL